MLCLATACQDELKESSNRVLQRGPRAGANGVAQPRAPRSNTPSTTGRAPTAASCKQSHADPKDLHTQRPSLCTATAPPGASAIRGSASCCVSTSQNWEASLATPHTHPRAWPEFLLADAAVSTPVFEPPVMPVHDTRLRFGGVMRFRTKRISHRLLHRIPWMDPAYVGEKAARRGP